MQNLFLHLEGITKEWNEWMKSPPGTPPRQLTRMQVTLKAQAPAILCCRLNKHPKHTIYRKNSSQLPSMRGFFQSIIFFKRFAIQSQGGMFKLGAVLIGIILPHQNRKCQLDYCNSLLYGIPEYQTMKLQRVMNASARLIYRAHKFCHITPLLAELHWLPVRSRIHYKILLITFKILHGLSPKYLLDLISIQQPSSYHVRRNDNGRLLERPSVKRNKTLGDRAFQISIFSPFGVFSEQCADLEDSLPDVETTHPPADDYTKFIQKLDKYFLPKKNKDYARFQLGNLQQLEDLSLAKYFAQVQEIDKKYEYHDENDVIPDH
ncbi:unnamed protein product [Porites evermanni]|uniref:Uncharacterized protein n=1 Tax=Porites evermanni TaxID=104178 RepID=A0ABN8RVJ3_9CNID|nr:unnamed protein product [Porites evermanni]